MKSTAQMKHGRLRTACCLSIWFQAQPGGELLAELQLWASRNNIRIIYYVNQTGVTLTNQPTLYLCDRASFQYKDVNNEQDATTFSFINLFNSALHVSGDKFAHPQEHFLTLYTAFDTMHQHCCRPVPRLRWNVSSISTVEAEFLRIQTTGRQHRGCIIPH